MKEESIEGDQKVTTYYEKKPRSYYEGTAKGDDRREGESRVEQNKRKREEARTRASSRPDSYESLAKEKKRKTGAEETIRSEAERVRSRQVIEELRESSAKKKQARAIPREPSLHQNIGSGVKQYVDARRGPPTWMGVGSGTPAFLRMQGPSRLPDWVMGAPSTALPIKRGKRSPPARNNGLPEWFRY